MRRRGYRLVALGFGVVCLLMVLAGSALVAFGPFDLASAAARHATSRLGRPVAIAALQVRVGAMVRLDLRDLVIDNLPGGSPGPFLRIGRLQAEIAPGALLAWALLGRPPITRHLAVSDVHLQMEHMADGRPNWRFGDPASPAGGDPRTRLPTLLDARLGDGAIDFHTSSGHVIQIRLDQAVIAAAAPDQPVTLTAGGAYDGSPVRLTAALQSFDRLHDATAPFGAQVHLASDNTLLDFDGTLTRPLHADGVSGKLTLHAPNLDRLLTIGGSDARFAAPISLAGGFERDGDLWRLTDGGGSLGGQPFALTARLKEGAHHTPDDIALDAGFSMLDLTVLGTGQNSGETALRIDADPGTLLDAHIAAKRLVYGNVRVEDLDVAAKLGPGTLTIDRLKARYAGGAVEIAGTLTNADTGASVRADGSLNGADAGVLAGLLGFGKLPIAGAIDARIGLQATGDTMNDAARHVGGGVALSMRDGTVARDLVEQASTDVRRLFRKTEEDDRVLCLFGLVDLSDGAGRIAPLRLRTLHGTIVGAGTLDLRRDTIDLTVATESATTSVFALDVPVRFAGPIEAPHLLPSVSGPTLGKPDLGRLTPAVQELAKGNPCLTAGR